MSMHTFAFLRTCLIIIVVMFLGGFAGTGSAALESKLGSALATRLPTGQQVTPLLPPNASFKVLKPALPKYPGLAIGGAVSEALSPDGNTLVVLTTGFNRWNDPETGKRDPTLQNEYLFIFDISQRAPVQKQVLTLPNSWAGVAFSADSKGLYVSGGVDDVVHTFAFAENQWAETGMVAIPLAHGAGIGPDMKPIAAGLAVTTDGSLLVVANMYNDSISVVNIAQRKVAAEIDLRPGKSEGASGVAGGTYPYWIVVDKNDIAYVSSVRDREIVCVDLASSRVISRIALTGNPNKMILNQSQTRLYVAMDNADAVAVIDTATRSLRSTIGTLAPAGMLKDAKAYGGTAPNSLALSANEDTLFVSNGGTNAIAMIALDEVQPRVKALIPTGWYPQHVVYGRNGGGMLYVINSKSVTGPVTGNCLGYQKGCPTTSPVKQKYNQYVLQLSKSSLQVLPVPFSPQVLERLTKQVAGNNTFNFVSAPKEVAMMQFLRTRIKHIIYIVRENRTYDQILGDLARGNGDSKLTEFGKHITPNQHVLAKAFVTLDNFYDPGEVSGNGWPWSTGGRESDFGVKMLPPNYAGRGGSYDWEGANRDVGMGVLGAIRVATNEKTPTDPDFLPGTANVAAPDGPGGQYQQGYLWSAALRAGLSVRNYGFFVADAGPREREPFKNNKPQAIAIDPELVGLTDVYFRGFDTALPETYREAEWAREFAQFVANDNLPTLSLVRFGQDHTGDYKDSIDGVNTPELQVAANDYAIGRLIEAVAKSKYAGDTLIFQVEDDCQDGPDHVDEHRSIAFVTGPYVKHGAVVSHRYSTVNMLRTIEDILGIDHLSLFTASQASMSEVFDTRTPAWTFTASVPEILRDTQLPLPSATGPSKTAAKPAHDAQYWIEATKGMDFKKEDAVDADIYNRILWKGLKGKQPYPEKRSGKEVRIHSNREDD